MIRDVSIELAGLVAYWSATLLYGINAVVFFICIYIMIDQRIKGNSMPLILFFSTVIQFILSTIHVALGLRRLIDSFIKLQFDPAAIVVYWTNPSLTIEVIANAAYITNTLIGDSIMVWRLYAVWGNNLYICIIPILVVLATAGTGYATVAGFLHASASNIFAVLNTYTATWALSVTTQTSVSLAIMGRIWWISRDSPKSLGSNRYFAIAWIIVESGAIYSLTTILLLIFYDLRTNFGGIINNMLAQTCAIVPTLVVVRVCLRRSYQPTNFTSYGSSSSGESTGPAIKFATRQLGTDGVVEVELHHTKGSVV